MKVIFSHRPEPKARTADLFPVPDAGVGKGVPLQPVPDPPEARGDRARALPH